VLLEEISSDPGVLRGGCSGCWSTVDAEEPPLRPRYRRCSGFLGARSHRARFVPANPRST
jgi:hypothetical protein